jgi:hypothetical protein
MGSLDKLLLHTFIPDCNVLSGTSGTDELTCFGCITHLVLRTSVMNRHDVAERQSLSVPDLLAHGLQQFVSTLQRGATRYPRDRCRQSD